MTPARDAEGDALGEEDSAFQGFPSSGRATAIPNLFFSRLLPLIDSPEELVVTLYFFFAQGLKRRSPRFLTHGELGADATLLRALAAHCGASQTGLLERGLALAVARGTLISARREPAEGHEELYLVNTPANRRALSKLEGVRIEETLPPAGCTALPNIFTLYEKNVGSITPLIADELKDAEQTFPAEWIMQAFREAASLNKRNWRYIHRILKRWEAEGPDYEKTERDPQIEWLERRYSQGKRNHSAPRAPL